MIAQINELILNDPEAKPGFLINGEISGLAVADLRRSGGLYAGRSGGYSGRLLYGKRPIAFTGNVWGDTPAEFESRRQELLDALTGDDGDVALRIITNGGAAYRIFAHLAVKPELPLLDNPLFTRFLIELEADDPLIYDDATGTELTATVHRKQGGGVVFPVIFPAVFEAGSGAVAVTNAGSAPVAPTIEIEGGATDPVITNTTTGQFLGLDLTTAPGDVIAIDMRQRTVRLNGGNVIGLLTPGSDFWELQPGSNSIELTSAESTDDIEAEVRWRSGYLGI